jgi:RNA polymerase sigma-70 factor (ECF subfamily)
MAAFERLVFLYEKRVVAVACRLCGDRREGEDLAQEVFIRVWRALPGYRRQASFNTWIMKILTNLWRDRLRKKQLPQESLDGLLEARDGGGERQFADGEPGPERQYEEKETGEILGKMLAELRPEYREVLVLRDIQQFSYDEVAAIVGCGLGTVKSRISRGRDALRQKILDFQEQNPGFFRLKQIKAVTDRTAALERREKDEG